MLRLLLAFVLGVVAYGHPTVLVDVSQESPLPIGTRLILTVLPEGTVKHWYRFKIKAPNQPTRLVKDFGPDNELLWAPMGQEGFYIIEITVRDLFEQTETDRVMIYEVVSNVQGKDPVVKPTVHPLVQVYSAPPCKRDSMMTVYFEAPGSGLVQSAPPLACDGESSMNTYLAGMRPNTDYVAYHVITTPDGPVTGPRVPFRTGVPPDDLAGFTAMNDAPDPRAQGVLLSSMIGTRPVGVVELRQVAVDRRQPRIGLLGDVDDERRTRPRRHEVVEDRLGLIGLALARRLGEVREVVGVRDDLPRLVVVVVPQTATDGQVVVRRQDDARAMAADHARRLAAVLERVLDPAITEVHALAHIKPQQLTGLATLLGAELRGAPAHVAGRHVDDAGRVAALLHLEQQSTAADLRVIGVRAESQDVDGHEGDPPVARGRVWGRVRHDVRAAVGGL